MTQEHAVIIMHDIIWWVLAGDLSAEMYVWCPRNPIILMILVLTGEDASIMVCKFFCGSI